MAKVNRESSEQNGTKSSETSTKLKPGGAPEQTKINTKVKAAKESSTSEKVSSENEPGRKRGARNS